MTQLGHKKWSGCYRVTKLVIIVGVWFIHLGTIHPRLQKSGNHSRSLFYQWETPWWASERLSVKTFKRCRALTFYLSSQSHSNPSSLARMPSNNTNGLKCMSHERLRVLYSVSYLAPSFSCWSAKIIGREWTKNWNGIPLVAICMYNEALQTCFILIFS